MTTKTSKAGFRSLWAGAAVAAALLNAPSIGAAETASNLAAGWSYPDAPCSKPTPPMSLTQVEGSVPLGQYQLLVETYNKRSTAYSQCVNRYLDNANEDIRRIQQKMEDAVATANAP